MVATLSHSYLNIASTKHGDLARTPYANTASTKATATTTTLITTKTTTTATTRGKHGDTNKKMVEAKTAAQGERRRGKEREKRKMKQ